MNCTRLFAAAFMLGGTFISSSSNFLGGDFGGGEGGDELGLGYFQSIFLKAAVQTSTSLSLRVDGEKCREVEGCG